MADVPPPAKKPLAINTPHVTEPANVATPPTNRPLHPVGAPPGAGMVNEGMKLDPYQNTQLKMKSLQDKLADFRAQQAQAQAQQQPAQAPIAKPPTTPITQGTIPVQKPLPAPVIKSVDERKTYIETQPFAVELARAEAELRKFETNPKLDKRRYRETKNHGQTEYL